MTDRWTRAEERYRQNAERRYRRDDLDWADADDHEDDTTVIPRYTDDDEQFAEDDGRYAGHGTYVDYDDEYEEEPAPRRRAARPAAEPTGRERVGRSRSGGRGSGRGSRAKSRVASRKAAERKRRRRNMFVIAGVFVVLFVGAAGFAAMKLMNRFTPPEDFAAGELGPLAIVQVKDGDTATQIAKSMYDKGVVASSGAFYEAAVKNSGMNSVQPGYYSIATHSPAAEAVTALVGKDSRVGNVVISAGRQLHDSADVQTDAPKHGIYRKIAEASCVGTGATAKCVTYEQLNQAGTTADLTALGVPTWAMDRVKNVPDPSRRLEGLITAGTLDFDPTGSPEQILRQLITESAARYEATGLLQSGKANGLQPYDTLIAASLVEREAKPNDMSKVARVIVNRLAVDQPLQFDSTVNYTLDKTEVATTDADRARKNPWNTYAMAGLPATPISSPSLEAMKAMENPAAGPWLYFVTVDKQGTTLFTEDYNEHLRNIKKAQDSGILDSGR
ncbi:endolytic transglycosylase MltG [Nocardia huaxiensis]|uniref:Endolytic murein transglycosylase n=1 Tax=Nocardia huaxiensis TaxID=2755382 RepID=A0A7D6Z7T5_9NOCA|nr:endolytic transglycosylase MltG [Nocardia huaxiensis]QLY29088.1 endolytic transglycosylase MltG [Nocardia huaxiensis]UFS97426.1 endolytic transglycosylase MltG [Nocardia huaxiensis]